MNAGEEPYQSLLLNKLEDGSDLGNNVDEMKTKLGSVWMENGVKSKSEALYGVMELGLVLELGGVAHCFFPTSLCFPAIIVEIYCLLLQLTMAKLENCYCRYHWQSGRDIQRDIGGRMTKSTGKRPMKVAEADLPTDVHAADPKRARLTGEKPELADALAHDAFSLPEMFNMLFQMSPPPAGFVNEKTDYVAGQVAHHISQVLGLFINCHSLLPFFFVFSQLLFTISICAHVRLQVGLLSFLPWRRSMFHIMQEIRELKEKVRYLEAQVDSLNQYPGSDQFFQDVAALFPSRPANLPALVKSFCSSEDVVAPLLQALHQDPVGLQALRRVTAWGYHRGKYVMQESLHRALADNVEDWEQVRALLPEQVPPRGPEPFNNPPVGPTNPHTADSRSHVP
nr:uncharacterized protein LOC109149872 [Ipomoea batatas]